MTSIRAPFLLCTLALSSVNGHGQTREPTPNIETIEIEGTRLDLEAARKSVAEIPGGATLVDMDDVRERNVSSLADMLRYVPGVWSASDSGNDDIFFSSRGSNLDATDYDMNGIKLLQDGLPVTAADGNNHNRIVDPLAARYATVARGANALTYGASTLGGAIDFVSPSAADIAPAEVWLDAGSFGQRLGRVTVGADAGELDALVTLEGKSWEGYRDHNAQNRWGAYSNVGWQPTDALATRFYATYLDNAQQLPGALSRAQVEDDRDQANPNAVVGDFELDVETWRLANKTTWRIDGERRLDVGVSLEEQHLYHPIVEPILVGDPPFEVFSLLIDTDQRTLGSMLRYEQRIGVHAVTLGMNLARTDVDGGNYRNAGGERNGLSEIVDDEGTSLEVFAIDRWQISRRLALVYGAQLVDAQRRAKVVDAASGAGNNPNDDYSSVNPRLGLMYDLENGTRLFANVSRLYEPPTNFELEDDARGGNDALRAMHGTVVEAGARGQREFGTTNRVDWDVTLYHAWIADEILSIDDPNAPGTSLSANVDDTVHAGLEALVSLNLALDTGGQHIVAPMISATINRFSFDGDPVYGHNELPAAPDYVLRGEIMYRNTSGFYVGPTFDLVGDRYADFVNDYEVDAYQMLGVRAGWNDDKLRVFIEARNVLDEEFIATHSVRDAAAADAEILNPGESRAVYVGVQARL